MLRFLRHRPRRPVDPVAELAVLLNRPAVRLDTPEIQRFLAGKRILVTGAGGSIGSEIARQAMRFCPERLILLDRSEFGLFEIDRELRTRWLGADLLPVIADITDRPRIRSILQEQRPHVVFHAAAHKHVPLMESNPGEAVKNNVLGTATLADAAASAGVGSFVLISTDKAVNPTSVMGATKRCAEMVVQALNGRGREKRGARSEERAARSQKPEQEAGASDGCIEPDSIYPDSVYGTSRSSLIASRFSAAAPPTFTAVRFGNVLGSSGSVVPIFARQIAEGGPVTVTHPEMRRFFMTIPEAAGLVMQAGAIGTGGEIFVLDMGQQVRILDVAKTMIRRAGLKADRDIAIRFTGIRPGEKLEEELAGLDEPTLPTPHPKIRVSELPQVIPGHVQTMLRQLSDVADGPAEAVLACLKRWVPEFSGESAPTRTTPPLRLAAAA